jgi:crotonobetainyl-CoA:carnitine CoA-transferase CaiB-like acyl-CoA transferase
LEHVDFQLNTARVLNREALNVFLSEAISKRSLEDLMAAFKGAGVPAARIRDMRQVFEISTAREMVLGETLENGVETLRMRSIAFRMQ